MAREVPQLKAEEVGEQNVTCNCNIKRSDQLLSTMYGATKGVTWCTSGRTAPGSIILQIALGCRGSYVRHMRRRWWVTIVLLCVLSVTLAVLWPRRAPMYEGKSLDAWLRDFDGGLPGPSWQAAEAVRHMGTNAVPILIAKVSHRQQNPEPAWHWRLRQLLGWQSVVKVREWNHDRHEALAALDALGPDAKAAVPALEKLLAENPPDQRAQIVLARIGPAAIPALSSELTNEQRVIRFGARLCMDMMQSNSPILSPKTPNEAEFRRRGTKFNLLLLGAAWEEYRAQHPQQLTQSTNPPADERLGDTIRYLDAAMGYRSNQPPAVSAPSAQPRPSPYE